MAKWKKLRVIGAGGFADVHLCVRNGDFSTRFALKKLKPGKPPQARERFLREIEIHRMIDHRNIVPVVAFNSSVDFPWYVMPLALTSIADTTIDPATGQPVSSPDHVWVVRDACQGLAEAHRHDIMHRDIKPQNILIFEDEHGRFAAVGDFGLGSMPVDESNKLTRVGDVMGTYLYMPPEQLLGAEHCTLATDVYSLGLVLFEILAGARSHPLDLSAVSSEFRPVIERACQQDPAARYQNAEEMLRALEAAMTQSAGAPQPDTSVQERARTQAGQLAQAYTVDSDQVRALGDHLLEAAADKEFLLRFVPKMLPELVDGLFADSPAEAAKLFEMYDAEIDETLSFGYYDVVADFYRNVFRATDDEAIRAHIIMRLSELGTKMNRYYLGRILTSLVCSTNEASVHEALARHLESNPNQLEFLREYFRDRSDVPDVIAQVFAQTSGET